MCRWHGAASWQRCVPLTPGDRLWESPGDTAATPCPVTLTLPAPTLPPCWELGQLLHKASTLARGVVKAVTACGLSPLHCPQGSSQQSREPALGSRCSAPGQFTGTAAEAHISACPAWLAVLVTALSPVPCRVSRDTTTTRTPGCSGWAPAIASSLSGSARYSSRQDGGPGTPGMCEPYSLWLLCQSTPSTFWVSPMKAGGALTLAGRWLAKALAPQSHPGSASAR